MLVVTSSWKVKMESCTVSKSETARKSSPNLGMIRVKATLKVGGRAKPTKNVFGVDAFATPEKIAEPRTYVNGGPPRSAPRTKALEIMREEEQESSQNVPLGILDVGSCEVLSDHGETIEHDVIVDESLDESTETMPPLPLVSWFKETRI